MGIRKDIARTAAAAAMVLSASGALAGTVEWAG